MSEWELLVGVLEFVAVGVVVITLGWAARERGKIHHRAVQLCTHADRHAAAHLDGRSGERLLAGLFRFTRRTRRIHLAVGAVAGCV